jgi:hypothetical protein
MKLVRSDSPEVAHCIASTRALVCWGSLSTLVWIASAEGLLIVLIVGLIVSVRAAAWLAVPVVLALNGYLLWRGRSPRLNWVLAGCAERVYVRLFVRRGKWGWSEVKERDVLVLEASEIASMSIRTVEVFLYGPKPKIVEYLVIKPAQAVAENVSSYIGPLLSSSGPILSCIPIDPNKQVFVGNREGAVTLEWKWCRPASRVFLQKLAHECPSVVLTRKERSELDLNGIWTGIYLNLDSEKRRLLIQAKRLGFGYDCLWLLSVHKYISFRKAAAYMAEIEREEAGAGRCAVQQ